MTPRAFLHKTLSEVCPGAYLAYAPGNRKKPPLPFYVYSPRHGEEFFADDENYAMLPRFRVELFFKENDPEFAERFEEALSRCGTWSRYDADWINSESCLYHDYRISVNLGKMRESEG